MNVVVFAVCIGLGVAFGAVIGITTHDLGLWMGVGVAIGAGLGTSLGVATAQKTPGKDGPAKPEKDG